MRRVLISVMAATCAVGFVDAPTPATAVAILVGAKTEIPFTGTLVGVSADNDVVVTSRADGYAVTRISTGVTSSGHTLPRYLGPVARIVPDGSGFLYYGLGPSVNGTPTIDALLYRFDTHSVTVLNAGLPPGRYVPTGTSRDGSVVYIQGGGGYYRFDRAAGTATKLDLGVDGPPAFGGYRVTMPYLLDDNSTE